MAVVQLYARQEPSRIEKKSFSDIEKVQFNHSFGNITVTESDSQQVELEIRYFDGEDAKPVCEISSGPVLKIKTVMPENSGSSGGWNIFGLKINFSENNANRSNNKRIGIDYVIAIPRNVEMKVNLSHGHMVMGDFYGDFTGYVTFGSLNVNTFHKSPVHITSKHSNIKIEKVEVLDISNDFSHINLNTVNTLKTQSSHSKHQIDEVGTIEANCSFGRIDIDSAVECYAKLNHTSITIKNLDKKLNLKCEFAGVNIKDCSKQLESIKFVGRHSGFTIKLDADLSAEFNVDLRYGKLSVDDKYDVKYSYSEKDFNKIIKKGTIGNKTPTAKIDVSNSFANVSIK
jgi:hypothetical protein